LRAIPEALQSMVTGSPFSSGVPGDIAAASFSTPEWEPSFYWGLLRPLLCSALRGGIAYEWGLRTHRPGPEIPWMLTPNTISSPGSAPGTTDTLTSDLFNPETGYVVFNLAGSYTSSDRHIDRVIDAIWRAMVSLARFGLVPPSSSS
jgi:hypothetical protein